MKKYSGALLQHYVFLFLIFQIINFNIIRHFIKKNTWLKGFTFQIETGWGNGYVILEKDHLYFNVNYDIINERISVHGGLTFSAIITFEMLNNWPELTSEDEGKFIVGFDTTHADDTIDKWPEEAVLKETEELAAQLHQIDEEYKNLDYIDLL